LKRYTFAELSAKEKPKGVDTNALEKYLSDEEFQKVLGVTRAQFEAFPGWKKIDTKKKKYLF
jgi:supervillin